jgi:hypothetical protein
MVVKSHPDPVKHCPVQFLVLLRPLPIHPHRAGQSLLAGEPLARGYRASEPGAGLAQEAA